MVECRLRWPTFEFLSKVLASGVAVKTFFRDEGCPQYKLLCDIGVSFDTLASILFSPEPELMKVNPDDLVLGTPDPSELPRGG